MNMKKILGLLVVLLTTPSVLTHGAEVTMKGDLRLRHVADMDKDGDAKTHPGTQSYWEQRFKLGTTFRAGEKFTGVVVLLHNHFWGNQLMSPETDGYPNSATPNVLTADNSLTVNEAFGNWMVSDELMFRFGRGSFEMADGSVIAKNDYQAAATAFDGMAAIYDLEALRSIFWYVSFADVLSESGDDEASSYGLSFDIKSLPDWAKMLNIHIIQNNSDTIIIDRTVYHSDTVSIEKETIPKTSTMRYGVTFGGDVMGGLDYNLVYASHSGTIGSDKNELDMSGTMMDIKLGYSLPDVMNLRIYGGYHSDTGSNKPTEKIGTYDAFFYDFHANAGEMDVLEWGNLTYSNIGLTLDPIEDVTLGAGYFMFEATEGVDGFHATGGISQGSSTLWSKASQANTDLGTEFDLWVTKKYNDQLSISLTYSQFAPGDYFAMENGGSYDTYSQLFIEGHLSF